MASDGARDATGLVWALANEHRLRILCLLEQGERSVSDLAHHLDLSQSSLSQHLARLRRAGIVATRRDGVTIFYRIADQDALALAKALSAIVAKRRGGA
jgi:DNA-binding transcriptional ArsR family regulator